MLLIQQVALYPHFQIDAALVEQTADFINKNSALSAEEFLKAFFALPRQQIYLAKEALASSELRGELHDELQLMAAIALRLSRPGLPLIEKLHVQLRGLHQRHHSYIIILLNYIRLNHLEVYNKLAPLLADQTDLWIKSALRCGMIFQEIVTALEHAKYSPIIERHYQISGKINPGFEKYYIGADIIFALAVTIERVKNALPPNNSYLVVDANCPRALQVDISQRMIYILPMTDCAVFNSKGSCKEVTDALGINLDNYTEAGIMTVVHNCSKRGLYTDSLEIIKQEAQLLIQLQPLPGIVKVISIAERKMVFLNKKRPGEMIEYACPSIIMEKLHDLAKWLSNNNPITSKITQIYDAISIVSELHRANFFHGDIKESNFLTTEQGRVKIIDFNFTLCLKAEEIAAWCAINKAKKCEDQNATYNMLFYHSIYPAYWFTPPDLLTTNPVQLNTLDDYKKIEIYAIGCLLFHLLAPHFGYLPWVKLIYDRACTVRNSFQELTQQYRWQILREHKQYVEDKLVQLHQDQELTNKRLDSSQPTFAHHNILYMLLNLMRYNPAERWSLEQAQDYIEKRFPVKKIME